MANISYIETTKSQLNNINILSGQRIICTDTGEEYYDSLDSDRVYIGKSIKDKVNEVTSQLNENTHKTINILTPEMFGAVGDGVTDDTTAIQLMFDSAKCGDTINFNSNTKYLISDTINIPRNVVVNGNNCFIMLSDNLAGKYVFNYGVQANNSIADTFLMFNQFKNFNIQKYGTRDNVYFNGILINHDCEIKNIYSWGLNKTITVSSSNYIDMIKIQGVNIWGKHGNDFAIDTGFMGDDRSIKDVHSHANCESYNIIHVGGGHNTCRIEGIINGSITCEDSMVELSNLHIETGKLTFNNTFGILKNLFYLKTDTVVPITINGNTTLDIENCLFNHFGTRTYSKILNDIEISNFDTANVTIKNCFKNMLPSSAITFRVLNGITLNSEEFNNNNFVNSLYSILRGNKIININNPNTRSNSKYNFLSQVYLDSNFKWTLPSGTYYYKLVYVLDEVRKIGYTGMSNEVNKQITNNEGSALIQLNGMPNSCVKLYRGTNSNEYDKSILLAPFSNTIYDTGNIVNSQEWNSRNASAIDVYFSGDNYMLLENGNVIINANTTPSVGTWKAGDRIINSSIKTGNVISWVYNGNSWIEQGTYN